MSIQSLGKSVKLLVESFRQSGSHSDSHVVIRSRHSGSPFNRGESRVHQILTAFAGV